MSSTGDMVNATDVAEMAAGGAAAAPTKPTAHAPALSTEITLPHTPADAATPQSALERFKASYQRGLKQARKKMIAITPAFIVNNASNILGGCHVATEIMMFSSGMPEGTKLIKNPSNPINWIKEPLQTVFTETFHNARIANVGEIFKGNVVKNVYERITNLDKAAERYRARPEYKGKLGNPWQFRTTMAGLVGWSLSTLIPEHKESDEEIERMAIKRRVSPVAYVAERLKQAVWFPEWHKHKSQMLGLTYSIIGTASIIGAWRGRTKINGIEKYTLNWGYLGTSIISFLSAFPMLFAVDEQRAYGGFGNIMLGRIPFLYFSIKQKYHDSDPGRKWYTLSSLSFQAENLLFTLIGGATKAKKTLSDGSVVEEITDHQELLQEAMAKANEVKRQRKLHRRGGFKDEPLGFAENAVEGHPSLAVSKDGKLEAVNPFAAQDAALVVTKDGALEEQKHPVTAGKAHGAATHDEAAHEQQVQAPVGHKDIVSDTVQTEQAHAPVTHHTPAHVKPVHQEEAARHEQAVAHPAPKPEHHAAKPATHIGGGKEVHRERTAEMAAAPAV